LIVVVVIGATLSSWTVRADQSANIPRIGVLAAPYANTPANEGLREGLRELGYIEDESIAVVRRSAGTQEELRSAAADLVRQKVNVIVVFSTPAARVALDATTVPVVFLVGDPVSTGLAAQPCAAGGQCHRRFPDLYGTELEAPESSSTAGAGGATRRLPAEFLKRGERVAVRSGTEGRAKPRLAID
jgi:hypothetical protein